MRLIVLAASIATSALAQEFDHLTTWGASYRVYEGGRVVDGDWAWLYDGDQYDLDNEHEYVLIHRTGGPWYYDNNTGALIYYYKDGFLDRIRALYDWAQAHGRLPYRTRSGKRIDYWNYLGHTRLLFTGSHHLPIVVNDGECWKLVFVSKMGLYDAHGVAILSEIATQTFPSNGLTGQCADVATSIAPASWARVKGRAD